MKRIILSIAVLFSSAALFAQTGTKKIDEGTLIYAVEWQLPGQMQAMAANFPTELKVYFKGDSSSMTTSSAIYTSSNILNIAKKYERLLLDIPMMGKKYSVTFTPEDQERIQANLPGLTLHADKETKTIAGFHALRYEVNEKKNSQTSEAWLTKDIEIIPNSLTRFYDNSYGVPLEFTSYMNGLSIRVTLKELQPGPVPQGSFTGGTDYENISLSQLMQLQGN